MCGYTRMALADFATRGALGSYVDYKTKIKITTGNLVQGKKYYCKSTKSSQTFVQEQRPAVPACLPLTHITHPFLLFQSPGMCFGTKSWTMQSVVCLCVVGATA